MEWNWIAPEDVEKRIDAEFYKAEFIAAHTRLHSNIQIEAFCNLWKEANRIYIGIAGFDKVDDEINYTPYLRPTDIGDDGSIDYSNLPWCKKSWLTEHGHNGCAKYGDLIIEVKGNTKKVTVINNRIPKNCIVSGSSYRINLKEGHDPYFFMSFFLSEIGQKLKRWFISNTTISYIDPDSFKSLEVPKLSIEVQNAIGNKVRKAERLREFSNVKINKANTLVEANIGLFRNSATKAYWVEASLIQKRLDCTFNSSERIEILRHLRKSSIKYNKLSKIIDISAMIGWKGLDTTFYRSDGPYLIRGVDFDKGVLNLENTLRVDYDKFLEQPQIHLQEGDILLTKDGTIGKALVMPKLKDQACAGSTVARLRPRVSLNSYFIELMLNHEICQGQIRSFATGMAQPHITQEWIQEIIIPRFENEDEIGEQNKAYKLQLSESVVLIENSKTDVEALIDGTLDIDALLADGAEIETWLAENPSPYATNPLKGDF